MKKDLFLLVLASQAVHKWQILSYLKDILKQVNQFHSLAALTKNLSAQGKAELLFSRWSYDVSLCV